MITGVMRAHKADAINKSWFSVYWIMFNPKKELITSDDAIKFVAKTRKTAKATVKADYDVIYAKAKKHRKKYGDAYFTYKICPKSDADVAFAFPKKYRKESKNLVSSIELPVD